MLEKIIGSEYMTLDVSMSLKVKERIEAEGILDSIQLIKQEANFYYKLINQIFTYFSYLTVGCPQ